MSSRSKALKRPNLADKSAEVKVFLSHSHSDRDFAVEIQRVLKKHGAATFLDQDEILVADSLPDRILNGIKACNHLLLLWSRAASGSHWVRKELDAARSLRKKVIPYRLDSTPLPRSLAHVVFLERSDYDTAHGGLLSAVFGTGYAPAPNQLFPGRWRMEAGVSGVVSSSYILDLRRNGQISGSQKIDQSGLLGDLAKSIGVAGMLDLEYGISGCWRYEDRTKLLILELEVSTSGMTNRDTVRIRTTDRMEGAICGEDDGGLSYRLWRVGAISEPMEGMEEEVDEESQEDSDECLLDEENRIYLAKVSAIYSDVSRVEQAAETLNSIPGGCLSGDPEMLEQILDEIVESYARLLRHEKEIRTWENRDLTKVFARTKRILKFLQNRHQEQKYQVGAFAFTTFCFVPAHCSELSKLLVEDQTLRL